MALTTPCAHQRLIADDLPCRVPKKLSKKLTPPAQSCCKQLSSVTVLLVASLLDFKTSDGNRLLANWLVRL